MRPFLLTVFAYASVLGQDSKRLQEAWVEGLRMDSVAARGAESKLAGKPDDLIGRTRLIAFYTLSDKADVVEATTGRRKHLLWLAQEKPEAAIYEGRPYATLIHVAGGRLPDPEGFAQVREVWLKHLSSNPSEKIKRAAATFLELGDRETAYRLIREVGDPRWRGTHVAQTLLGVTARNFQSGEPLAADPSVRATPLVRQIATELQESKEPQFIGEAGFVLARDGGILWNRGYKQWDYSALAKDLLARAQQLEPATMNWFSVNPDLPKPGERRGIGPIRVGGGVMGQRIRHKVDPVVPSGLKKRGTVTLDVAIGPDGRIWKVIPEKGPPELYAISIEAVEQWVYEPTIMGDAPVVVLTRVTFDFK
jgi:hypothetical protein